MRLSKPSLILLLAALTWPLHFASAQNDNDVIDRPTSDPYKGDLAIFEGADRAKKLQVERVMDLLGIRKGAQVADIGAGSGWFTVRAARRVGESGVIYAVEINRDYLRHIQQRATDEKLRNVRTVLSQPDNPLLAEKSFDAALLLKTYHEVAQPIALLRHLRAALKPGARLGIIDKNGNGSDHGLNAEVVIKEAARAGFTLAERHDDLVKADGMDYFLIFAPNKSSTTR